jgi:alpha-mannosidase
MTAGEAGSAARANPRVRVSESGRVAPTPHAGAIHRPTRDVHVVAHTHWDREWYAPFQVFRLKLVDLLDELLPRLERGEAGPHFLLDGQMAAVDDYLELRPEMAERLAALVTAGRLEIGPWYVLPDEFLVSGETLVRDLQRGLRRAAPFGGAMEVGYLPDMFGHVAQMPQILRLFGLERAVVWRGVPASVRTTRFRWVAPDGSSVDAEYLPEGYGNGAYLPADPAQLASAVDAFVERHGDMLDGPILWMNGTDHQEPARHFVATLDGANRSQDRYRFVATSLAAHLTGHLAGRVPASSAGVDEPLPVHVGELRSGARANLLMGVTSNRVDVRSAAAPAETALERVTEPLCALFTSAAQWPSTALDLAWREVIRNAAHDSVCACSHDDVVDAVLHRYAEARAIAATLSERALYWFGCTLAHRGTAVVNTTQRARRALVDLPGGRLSVTVPPFGWRVVGDDVATGDRAPSDHAPVLIEDDGRVIDNGLRRVTFDELDGTFAIDGLAGCGRLVDSGDEGDTYNWCPPRHDLVVDAPDRGEVHVLEHDAVAARVAVDRTYTLPSRIVDGRRTDPRRGVVRTVVELRTGEPFVRTTVELHNVWCDHRLRLMVPLRRPTDRSAAECAFAVVERGLAAEGGPTELGLPTFPARRFVSAGGSTVAFDAVTEYELVDIDDDGAHTLALTVLRSTAMLSRGPMTTRPLPAGPELPLAGAQVQRRVTRRFAIAPSSVDPYEPADAFVPFLTVRAPGGGTRPAEGSALRVSGGEVTAVTRDDGALVVRAFNPHGHRSVLTVDGGLSSGEPVLGRVVDLRGDDGGAFTGALELRPHQIVTLRLAEPSGS